MHFAFSSKKFTTSDQLEDYVKTKGYDTSALPGICAAIEVSGSMGDYRVKLRYDDDDYDDIGNPKQIPSTRFSIVGDAIRYDPREHNE